MDPIAPALQQGASEQQHLQQGGKLAGGVCLRVSFSASFSGLGPEQTGSQISPATCFGARPGSHLTKSGSKIQWAAATKQKAAGAGRATTAASAQRHRGTAGAWLQLPAVLSGQTVVGLTAKMSRQTDAGWPVEAPARFEQNQSLVVHVA